MAISTRDLKLLPDIDVLRRAIQSIAMLDAILSPEWEFRYYSFNLGLRRVRRLPLVHAVLAALVDDTLGMAE